MKLLWSQGTTGGGYLPSSASMHDNNEKLTSAFPKEQPTDAETAEKSWSRGGSHEKRQPFKKILHWILVLISLGMQRPSPWTCLHPGQFGNGEKCQKRVWQHASHSANALPFSRAGRALGPANTAGDELWVTSISLFSALCAAGQPLHCSSDGQGLSVRSAAWLTSCSQKHFISYFLFLPKKSIWWLKLFLPWGMLLFTSSFTLTFPPTAPVAYQKIKAKWKTERGISSSCSPWHLTCPWLCRYLEHSLLV